MPVPTVIFVHADGREQACTAVDGTTVLDCALDAGVQGLGGQCGGAATCGTCHCYVAPGFMARVGPPEGDEADLIPWLDAPQANSRLACQIRLTADLDGLRVWIPGEL